MRELAHLADPRPCHMPGSHGLLSSEALVDEGRFPSTTAFLFVNIEVI